MKEREESECTTVYALYRFSGKEGEYKIGGRVACTNFRKNVIAERSDSVRDEEKTFRQDEKRRRRFRVAGLPRSFLKKRATRVSLAESYSERYNTVKL